MKTFKYLLSYSPELYFIAFFARWTVSVFTGYDAAIHYPAIAAIAVLLIQLFVRNHIIGYTIAAIIATFSIYLVFALLSDLNDAAAFDKSTLLFLVKGGLLIIVNLLMAAVMIRRQLKAERIENARSSGRIDL